ncbi:MAG: PIN domain-containing protein [bacterium]
MKKRSTNPEHRYWDSTVFLAWLLPEKDRIEDIRAVLDAAERGKVLIVTSALTLVEVIKLKGHPSLPREQERKIREFFQRSFVLTRGFDQFTAIDARELIWKHGLMPKDSVHVATALRARLRILETHDRPLIDLNQKLPVPGGAPMTIRQPHFSETLPLRFGQAKGKVRSIKGDGK